MTGSDAHTIKTVLTHGLTFDAYPMGQTLTEEWANSYPVFDDIKPTSSSVVEAFKTTPLFNGIYLPSSAVNGLRDGEVEQIKLAFPNSRSCRYYGGSCVDGIYNAWIDPDKADEKNFLSNARRGGLLIPVADAQRPNIGRAGKFVASSILAVKGLGAVGLGSGVLGLFATEMAALSAFAPIAPLVCVAGAVALGVGVLSSRIFGSVYAVKNGSPQDIRKDFVSGFRRLSIPEEQVEVVAPKLPAVALALHNVPGLG